MGQEGACVICGTVTTSKCGNCKTVYYCSKEHQKQHWKTHKESCVSFEIQKDEIVGRYLCAKRDIAKGEIIIKEKPLLRGPSQITPPVCLGCHMAIQNLEVVCDQCGWPVCSKSCSSSPLHRPECLWAVEKRKDKVKISQISSSHPTYAAITPLRFCYLKKSNPSAWEKLMNLESHCEERKKSKNYEHDRFSIVQLLRRFYKLENDFSEEEILKMCGIIQVNGHEIPLSEPAHIAVYWNCSLLEHDCIPNCSKSFSDQGEIIIRAALDIKKGDHLSICYTDPFWGTINRQIHLSQTKFFSCNCSRCQDLSERNTYFSAVCCTSGGCKGFLVPESFIDKADKDWKCTLCGLVKSTEDVGQILGKVAENVKKVDKQNINSCIKFLKENSNLVPDSHYHPVEVKLSLAQLYGQTSSAGLKGLTSQEIMHKEAICRQLLKLTDVLMPAEYRVRGILNFELHGVVAEKARRGGEFTEERSLYSLLMESKTYLELAIYFLKCEPMALPEGKICQQARQNMKDLEKLLMSLHAAAGNSPW